MKTRDRSADDTVRLNLLRAHMDMGMTFASLASTAMYDTAGRERNRTNAGNAYATVTRFLPRFSLTRAERSEFEVGLDSLMQAIVAIP